MKCNRTPRSGDRFRIVNSNPSVFGDDEVSRVADDAARHSNAALGYQLFGFRPRRDSKLRECSIEPDDTSLHALQFRLTKARWFRPRF